jgi:hypothetical protein
VNDGRGLILAESKYTEHSFCPCSARIATDEKKKRLVNPDPKRCDHAIAVLDDPKGQYHQVAWGRKYWDHLASISECELSRVNQLGSGASTMMAEDHAAVTSYSANRLWQKRSLTRKRTSSLSPA